MNSSLAREQTFRFLKQFDEPPFQKKIRCRDKLRKSDTRWFPGELLSSVFARALCEQRAIPFKEVLESFEFYACVRPQIRKSTALADLCCGHGLAGILFAMFERNVEHVTLLDKYRPASFDAVLAAAISIAPWVEEKVRFVASPLSQTQSHLAPRTAILAIHACGEMTDQSIEHAISLGGPVALLPCCRDHSAHDSPPVLKQVLGADVAIDIDRTYRLHAAGYHVRWDQIPPPITPMHRVLIGSPKG